jgi:hypothetical protein
VSLRQSVSEGEPTALFSAMSNTERCVRSYSQGCRPFPPIHDMSTHTFDVPRGSGVFLLPALSPRRGALARNSRCRTPAEADGRLATVFSAAKGVCWIAAAGRCLAFRYPNAQG